MGGRILCLKVQVEKKKGTGVQRTLAQKLESKGVTSVTRVLGLRNLDFCFALMFEVPVRIVVGFHHGVGGLMLGEETGD